MVRKGHSGILLRTKDFMKVAPILRFFFFNDPAPPEISPLPLHDALPISLATDEGLIYELQREDTTGLAHALRERRLAKRALDVPATELPADTAAWPADDPDLRSRSEEHTSELQSRLHLVCRLLLEKKKKE